MSRDPGRAADGSEGPGEKTSGSGGAGVSGGASRGFLTSTSLIAKPFTLAIPGFLGRVLSFGRVRSRAIFAKSSLASVTLSLLRRLTLAGELVGSVFTLSAASLGSFQFAIVYNAYLARELSCQLP